MAKAKEEAGLGLAKMVRNRESGIRLSSQRHLARRVCLSRRQPAQSAVSSVQSSLAVTASSMI